MEKFVINGRRKLSGRIVCESAKNAVLPMLAASILTKEEVVIANCPKIYDVLNMIKILNTLGVHTRFEENNLIINPDNVKTEKIPLSLSKELRSSIFLLGPLVSRCKKAEIGYPGGCDIGLRPVDIHIKALKKMNVNIVQEAEQITCTVDNLIGADIRLDFPSVGATENAMLAGVLAEGKTQIHNAAKEPEIVDLMKFLNSMGAKVYGAGTSTILIEGVKNLHGTTYVPIGDRIEAGTYMIASAITGGEMEIVGCNPKNISSLLHKFSDNSCKVTVKDDIIYLKSGMVRKSANIETGPYPYFPTDLQAPFTSLLTVSDGESVITENIFEMRYKHVSELIKMGADITVNGKNAFISGVKCLHGAKVSATDLRGGASLVIAGLSAEGETEVSNVFHVDRGYFDFEKKLTSLGASIKRIN